MDVNGDLHAVFETPQFLETGITMRSLLLVTLIISGCTQEAMKPTKPTLVAFTSPDGKFSIDFPGEPQQETTPANPLLNKVEGKLFLVDHGDHAYLVQYTRFANKTADVEKAFRSGRDNMLLSTGGKLLEEKDLQVQGWPARELLVEIPSEKAVQRVQIILTDFELFQVIASGPRGTERTPPTNDYFQSFKLLDVQKEQPNN